LTENQTLPEKVQELENRMNALTGLKDKKKPFKLKWGVTSKLANLVRKKRILVFTLDERSVANVDVYDVKEGYILYEGVPRFVGNAYTYLFYGKYPCIFLRTWDFEPIGNKDYYDTNPNGISKAHAAKMIYAVVKSEENMAKKPVNVMLIVIIIVVGIAAFFIFSGGIKFS
jgi:hypothetical protein